VFTKTTTNISFEILHVGSVFLIRCNVKTLIISNLYPF